MSKSTYPLKLPSSVKEAARGFAERDGVSLNQWISAAVAEKVGVMAMAEEFFKSKAAGATAHDLLAVLAKAPDRPADPGDDIA